MEVVTHLGGGIRRPPWRRILCSRCLSGSSRNGSHKLFFDLKNDCLWNQEKLNPLGNRLKDTSLVSLAFDAKSHQDRHLHCLIENIGGSESTHFLSKERILKAESLVETHASLPKHDPRCILLSTGIPFNCKMCPYFIFPLLGE